MGGHFHWDKPWDEVVEHNFDRTKGAIFTRWFAGGRTNIAYNCLDHQIAKGHGNR